MHTPDGPEIRSNVIFGTNGFRGESADTVGAITDIVRLCGRDTSPVASNAASVAATPAFHIAESWRRGEVKCGKGPRFS